MVPDILFFIAAAFAACCIYALLEACARFACWFLEVFACSTLAFCVALRSLVPWVLYGVACVVVLQLVGACWEAVGRKTDRHRRTRAAAAARGVAAAQEAAQEAAQRRCERVVADKRETTARREAVRRSRARDVAAAREAAAAREKVRLLALARAKYPGVVKEQQQLLLRSFVQRLMSADAERPFLWCEHSTVPGHAFPGS
jgi:hypothetical protein